MKRKTFIMIFLVFCIAVLAFAMSQIPQSKLPSGEGGVAVEQAKAAAAPDFTLRDISGKMVSLADQKGKLVFLHFWASWCPPCKEELPIIQQLYEDSDKAKFVIMAINVKEGEGAVKPFIQEHGFTFPVQLDIRADVSRQYQVRSIPTTFFIDQQGNIIGKVTGARKWKWEEFKSLLK